MMMPNIFSFLKAMPLLPKAAMNITSRGVKRCLARRTRFVVDAATAASVGGTAPVPSEPASSEPAVTEPASSEPVASAASAETNMTSTTHSSPWIIVGFCAARALGLAAVAWAIRRKITTPMVPALKQKRDKVAPNTSPLPK